MKKSEFIEAMKDYASKYGNAVVKTIDRASTTYTGLMIERPGEPTPVINLDAMFKDYLDEDTSLDTCYKRVDRMLNAKLEGDITPADILNWNKIKDRLYLRLLGTITGGIYREMEDLYIVPYILVANDGSATARVTPELLGAWGVDENTVFDVAKTNQETLCPAKVTSMAERIGLPADMDIGVYIVSTKNGICGATAILYENVANRLRDKIGDFYLLPSSIHEFIAVPKSLGKSVDGLLQLVTSTNDEMDERDKLTDSVYTFDFDNNKLAKVYV